MSKAKTFTKAALFTAAKAVLKPTRITLEELGGDVHIKRHTLAERERYNVLVTDAEQEDRNAVGVSLVLCDEHGELMFTADDVPAIKGLPSSVTTQILYQYNIINGLITPIADQVDVAKKNS